MCVNIDTRSEEKVGERWKANNEITERGTIGQPNMFYIQFGNSHKAI